MKVSFAIIVLSITWLPNVFPQRIRVNTPISGNNYSVRDTRQTNADQMVHNILNWLEGVQAEKNRRIRQDGLRTYLPPNTQKPRPFEPAPPEENTIPGMFPPEMPEEVEPQSPVEQTSEPQYPGAPAEIPGVEPGPNEITGPPDVTFISPREEGSEEISPGQQEPEQIPSEEQGPESIPSEKPGFDGISFEESEETPSRPTPEEQVTPGEEINVNGYPPSGQTPQPPFTIPPRTPEGPGHDESTGYTPTVETAQPSFSPGAHPFTPEEPEISSDTTMTPFQPLGPQAIPEEPTPPESTGYPSAGETPQPPFVSPESSDGQETPAPTIFEESSPVPGESTPPPEEVPSSPVDVTGYPPARKTPEPSFSVPETSPEIPREPSAEATPTPNEEEQPGSTTTSTFPPILRETERPSPSESSSPTEQPSIPETSQPSLPETNGSSQPQPEPTDSGETPSLPEVNVAERTTEEPSSPGEDDLKHPPHVHNISVECAKEMMTINIEFNRQFDGIIYSKGFYSNSDCRYVNENSGQTSYSFSVRLDSCGTQFVNAFDTENQSYLENVLVLQNEAGIQEVWDTVRSVRCLWEGSLSKSLTVSLSVGMLSEEIVTFSGDTAVARLDIQRGEGPFAPSATGLVPIGERMTLVVSVSGDPGFDLQVKDCKAKDTGGDLEYALTDEDGCVLRPKLFGAFQKTRNTGNTDASIIAYAFFSAFKFPDLMDLMIECNVELCKTDCDVCPNPDQKIQPGKRRRRDVYNETLGEPVKVGKLLRVLIPADLSDGERLVEIKEEKEFCMSLRNFVISFVMLISLLLCSACFCCYLYLKRRTIAYKHQL